MTGLVIPDYGQMMVDPRVVDECCCCCCCWRFVLVADRVELLEALHQMFVDDLHDM